MKNINEEADLLRGQTPEGQASLMRHNIAKRKGDLAGEYQKKKPVAPRSKLKKPRKDLGVSWSAPGRGPESVTESFAHIAYILAEMSVGKMADMARRGREQRKAKGELKSADSAIGRIRRNLPTSQANTFQHRVLNPDATKPRSRSQGDAEMGDQRKVPTSGEDTGMRGHDQGRGQSRVAKKAAKADEDKQRAAGAEKAAKKKAERKWKVKPVASGGTDEAGRPLRTESISDTYSRLAHIFLEAFAGPTASKYGDSRSSAGIKDPQVKADAKKAKARMDKKLGVKTNPRAKDAVQAAMNTRRSAARRGETPAGSIDNLKR